MSRPSSELGDDWDNINKEDLEDEPSNEVDEAKTKKVKEDVAEADRELTSEELMSIFGFLCVLIIFFIAIICEFCPNESTPSKSEKPPVPKIIFHRPNTTTAYNCKLLSAEPGRVVDTVTVFAFSFEYDHPYATLENWSEEFSFSFRHSSYVANSFEEMKETIDNYSEWAEPTRMGLTLEDIYLPSHKKHALRRVSEKFNKDFFVDFQIVTDAPIEEKDSIITVHYYANCADDIKKQWN